MVIGRKTIGTVGYMGGIMAPPEPFTKAWGDMIQYNYEYLLQPTERISYTRATVSYHAFARDSLIDEMRGDWILMLDTDVIFEPDVVALMLQKMSNYNIDVLVGIYPYKGALHAPVLYGYNPKNDKRFIVGDWDKRFDVIECDGAGAGCLMIKRSVVQKIKASGESLFAIIPPNSEDNSFFMRCRKLGIKTYFSPNIKLKHLMYRQLSIDEDYPQKDRIVKREGTTYGSSASLAAQKKLDKTSL